MMQTAPRAARHGFCKWRKPAQAWAEFREWWAEEYPGRPLPGLYGSLPDETGLSLDQLKNLGVTQALLDTLSACQSRHRNP